MNAKNQGSNRAVKTALDQETDKDIAELKVHVRMRWRVWNPYHFLNMGGKEAVEGTLTSLMKSAIRSIASRVHPDALIGQKLEASERVNGSLKTENHDEFSYESYKPWHTLSLGVLLCIGIVCFLIPWMFELTIIPRVALIAIGIGWFLAGKVNIPAKHAGVVEVLGRRLKGPREAGVLIDEGDHWLIWPIIEVAIVDMKEQTTTLKDDTSIVVIAGNGKNATDVIPPLDGDIKSDFAETSGTVVLQVILQNILPANPEVLAAQEKIRIERSQRESEQIELNGALARVEEFQKSTGVSGEFATNAVFVLMGKEKPMDQTLEEIKITGATDADKALGTFAAAVKMYNSDDKRSGGKGGKR